MRGSLVLRLQLVHMCQRARGNASARTWSATPEHAGLLRLIVVILVVTKIICA